MKGEIFLLDMMKKVVEWIEGQSKGMDNVGERDVEFQLGKVWRRY